MTDTPIAPPPDSDAGDDVRWFPTARALRAIGYAVPCIVADDEPLVCVGETVTP